MSPKWSKKPELRQRSQFSKPGVRSIMKYILKVGGGEAEEDDQLGGEGGTGAHTGELIQGKGLLHNLECFPKHH